MSIQNTDEILNSCFIKLTKLEQLERDSGSNSDWSLIHWYWLGEESDLFAVDACPEVEKGATI